MRDRTAVNAGQSADCVEEKRRLHRQVSTGAQGGWRHERNRRISELIDFGPVRAMGSWVTRGMWVSDLGLATSPPPLEDVFAAKAGDPHFRCPGAARSAGEPDSAGARTLRMRKGAEIEEQA